jgi:DNA (cytosine-5)-methyltransferase 1
MIDFYNAFFKKSYGKKVEILIKDIERLFLFENINIAKAKSDFLDQKYRNGLSDVFWQKLQDLYYTLELEKGRLSPTLSKYLLKKTKDRNSSKLFIDSFAGCGGLSLGLTLAGFNPKLINEIEPRFLETFYFNHNLDCESYFCDDIRKLVDGDLLEESSYKNLDLVVGGPPCQGFSMANRQRILDDPRNDLYKQFLKLLNRTRPKFFIMENVKGMMKKSNEIIENFESILGTDYSIRIILLNAKNFGVPQNRERVFVIGTRLKKVDMDKVIEEIATHRFSKRKYYLKDALFGLPELKQKQNRNKSGEEDNRIGYKYSLKNIKKTNDFLKFIGVEGDYLSNHINRYNNNRDVEIYSRLPQGGNSLHPSIEDIMPYTKRNHIFKDKYFKLKEEELCKTITSHMKLDCNMYIHPTQPRGLSPREAARVQTFPEEYVFMGSNNLWYAQIGNAVPVKLAQAIGEVIMNYLN